MDYKQSGVDIDAGNQVVRRIRELARRTFSPPVLSDIGLFGGLFRPDFSALREPVLVASADGVGTKLKVAFRAGRHDSIGIDLVNHCVNDILVQGAGPLFFLDYLATGVLSPDVVEAVVGGIADGCCRNGCALLGGETAEMPGFYAPGEYDVAGFIVGVVDRGRLVDGRGIQPGDVLIGLPSSGLHTNGYSLARRIVFDRLRWAIDRYVPELGRTIGEELLEPHRSYLAVVRPVLSSAAGPAVKGMAHITGGGVTGNLPRILPEGTAARVDAGSWVVPPIFTILQREGAVPDDEMRRTFNMGIGLILVCARPDADRVLEALIGAGERGATVIGEVVAGDGSVRYATRGWSAGSRRRLGARRAHARPRGGGATRERPSRGSGRSSRRR